VTPTVTPDRTRHWQRRPPSRGQYAAFEPKTGGCVKLSALRPVGRHAAADSDEAPLKLRGPLAHGTIAHFRTIVNASFLSGSPNRPGG
jgi:hypothetical protein